MAANKAGGYDELYLLKDKYYNVFRQPLDLDMWLLDDDNCGDAVKALRRALKDNKPLTSIEVHEINEELNSDIPQGAIL